MKKMDSLTPQEYLTACELGIQNRSRTYIRARLDTAERLDKKCGASGIADNKTCHVGRGKGPVGRLKAANKTWEARYGKRPKTSNKDKIKALGITALAVGAGVGAAALVNKVRNKGNKPAVPFDLGNIRVPKPGAINKPGTASDLAKAADRGRLNELESLARGNNPALEAQIQVSKARNNEVRKSLENAKSELQRLRSEIGVWGPNRIKPFKRKRSQKDSVWADGFSFDSGSFDISGRIDTAERLDLKCGNGAISEGEKCTKGTAQKVQPQKASVGQRVKAGASLLALGAGTVGQAAFTGAAFGAGLSGNAKAAGRYTQAAAGFGALKGAGLAGIGAKKAAREELAGAATGALVGSLLSGDLEKGARSVGRAAREGAPMTMKRLKYARSNARGRARMAALRNAPLPSARIKNGRVMNPWTGDSVYATGFTPELDQLAS